MWTGIFCNNYSSNNNTFYLNYSSHNTRTLYIQKRGKQILLNTRQTDGFGGFKDDWIHFTVFLFIFSSAEQEQQACAHHPA